MNAFQRGTWSFLSSASDRTKEWEVTYIDRVADRPARALFHTEADAIRFADVTGGKAKKIAHRGGYK